MLGKVLIGGVVIAGLGYAGYRVFQAVKKTGAPAQLPTAQQQADMVAQQWGDLRETEPNPFNGGCVGCFGAASVSIL